MPVAVCVQKRPRDLNVLSFGGFGSPPELVWDCAATENVVVRRAIHNGVEDVLLPLDQFPATMLFIEYPPPAILEGKSHKNGVLTNASRLIQVAGPPLGELAKKFDGASIQFKSTFEGLTYERLLLKVAYCFTIAALGFESLGECYVLPSILGDSEEIGTWLGCDGETHLNSSGFHSASISAVGQDVICRVRLFSRFPVPEYVIVVGRLKEAPRRVFQQSEEKYF